MELCSSLWMWLDSDDEGGDVDDDAAALAAIARKHKF